MSDIDKKIENELKRRRGSREKHEEQTVKKTKYEIVYSDGIIWKYDLKKNHFGPYEVINKI